MSKSKIPDSFSYIDSINCGKIYEVYANQSLNYNVYYDVIHKDDGERYGVLLRKYDFNSRVLSNKETDIPILVSIIEDSICCKDDDSSQGCVVSGGKLRKTKRSSRSRKNRRIKKTKRRRGKK
jgi:hypothetical protein